MPLVPGEPGGDKNSKVSLISEDAGLGERIELLRLFLESADFRELRRESEKHPIEGRTVRFVLYLEEGVPRHQMIVDT